MRPDKSRLDIREFRRTPKRLPVLGRRVSNLVQTLPLGYSSGCRGVILPIPVPCVGAFDWSKLSVSDLLDVDLTCSWTEHLRADEDERRMVAGP